MTPTEETMRRVIVSQESIDVVRVPVPTPTPTEVLVRTTVSGVCGSDTHAAHGRHPFLPLPYRPGHEVVGVVESVGAEVTRVRTGDRVTVEPTLPCWDCKMCRTGRQNLCENLGFFGCGHDQGGMADFFTIPADRLHQLPDDLDDFEAALIEPLATPVHAARLAGDLKGKKVVVLGAGTIGLLVMKVARHHGAQTIVMTDMLASKRERAKRLGADVTVNGGGPDVVGAVRSALGESADVVFDCVATQQTVDQAITLALKAGTVVIVGVAERDVRVPLPVIQDQQVRLQGSATYLPEDFEEAQQIIRSGAVTANDFITRRVPLDRVAEAFALSSEGEQVKVVVTV